MIRLDTSRMNEYLYTEQPKLSFWQKLGRGVGKALSFLGPIGAAVTAIAVPGVGIPIAAGLYGLSNVAGSLTAKAEAKDIAQMQAYQSETAKLPVAVPGLFEQASQVDIQLDFMTPKAFEAETNLTIINREIAQYNAIQQY